MHDLSLADGPEQRTADRLERQAMERFADFEPTPIEEIWTIANAAPVLATWLRARVERIGDDWSITGLEMYADEACKTLIHDDIDLPAEQFQRVRAEVSRLRDLARERLRNALKARRSALAELGV